MYRELLLTAAELADAKLACHNAADDLQQAAGTVPAACSMMPRMPTAATAPAAAAAAMVQGSAACSDPASTAAVSVRQPAAVPTAVVADQSSWQHGAGRPQPNKIAFVSGSCQICGLHCLSPDSGQCHCTHAVREVTWSAHASSIAVCNMPNAQGSKVELQCGPWPSYSKFVQQKNKLPDLPFFFMYLVPMVAALSHTVVHPLVTTSIYLLYCALLACCIGAAQPCKGSAAGSDAAQSSRRQALHATCSAGITAAAAEF